MHPEVSSEPRLTSIADTDEGLGRVMATMVYSRLRMLNNLGPLLERAPTFRRVVSMLAGTKEGHVFLDDIPARNVGFLSTRSHMTAIMTLWLELSASKWPSVSFIHNFPGAVESNLLRRESVGPVIATVAWLFSSAFRLFGMSHDECGERHAYLCSSAKFPAGAPVEGDTNGVALDGLGVATGTDGKTGSGTYSITEYAEGTPAATLTVLDGLRKQGSIDKIREYVEGDFIRITGSAALNL